MIEGTLYTNRQSSGYALNSPGGKNITQGQAVEILLAGRWIEGHIEVNINSDEDNDPFLINEASEESFPASDPPAWPNPRNRVSKSAAATPSINNYYFVADIDGSRCGLCTGMRIRLK